ncbi:MAG: TIGR01212 family radical SAM protein [Paludibacteraceae bacterium]|nr:TIGR01212 family radical SAM protein [Paludibacteraceae bacterium]
MRKSYSEYLSQFFPFKVQKLAINAGFTCPNRDGTVGWGGCSYCNNQSFNPDYSNAPLSVSSQIASSKAFFARKDKYKDLKYLAYFQAYTNTYGELEKLKSLYEEALRQPDIVGLVVGTRPDCINDELLDYFEELNRRTYVMIEYGIESCSDEILEKINRGHNFECAVNAINATAKRNIQVAAHLILGLPFESKEQMLKGADEMSNLPINVLKLHQLQIVKGTRMAKEYEEHPEWFELFTPDSYIELLSEFLPRLREDIVVERFVSQTPKSILVAPDWGLKNYEFNDKLKKKLGL